MQHRTEEYYNRERQLLYESLLKNLSEDVKYTDLSFDEFVDRYFKDHTKDEFGQPTKLAPFHLELVNLIVSKVTLEAVVQVARNHAKTTVFSLFLPIYLMLRGETHFVLLVAATKDLAVKQIMNIQAELETNTELIKDFGKFAEKGNWSRGNFIVDNYQTAFYCVGKGQSTRGLKFKNYRPDFVVLDDIDTDREVLNKSIIDKQTNWVLQSIFPAMSIKKYRFIALGNKFAPDMILTRLIEEIEDIIVLKVNAIDEVGNVVWENRFSLENLLNIKKKIGSIRFEREFMNNPIVKGAVLKQEWLSYFTHTSQKFQQIITYVDPSFKKNGDYKACITVGFANNIYYILDMFIKRCNMDVVFDYLYQLNDKYGNIHISYVEANFAQDSHKETYEKVSIRKNANIPIRWDKSKKPDKLARIEALSVYFENGTIILDSKIKDLPDFKEFVLEYLTFPTGKNDDALDALEGAITTLNKQMRRRNEILQGGRQTEIF